MAAILNAVQFLKNAQHAQGGIKLIFHQYGVLYQKMQKKKKKKKKKICYVPKWGWAQEEDFSAELIICNHHYYMYHLMYSYNLLSMCIFFFLLLLFCTYGYFVFRNKDMLCYVI